MLVHGVQPKELDRFFPLAAPWIYQIPRFSERYKLQDALDELQSGNWQLWAILEDTVEGVLLTSVVQFPRSTELHLLGVAGRRMKEWLPLMKTIENYGRTVGCDRIVMFGARKGFMRLFKEYDGAHVILEKRL